MRKTIWIPIASLAAFLGVQQSAQAVVVYGFETNMSTGNAANGHPNVPASGPDGFYNSSLTTSQSTSGVTEGSYSLSLVSTASQTFGGAITAYIPATLADPAATSLQYDITVPAQPDPGYADMEATFFTNDGALQPDRSQTDEINNIDFIATGATTTTPGTYTETLNLAVYMDPDGVLSGDQTPGAILAADQLYDLANGYAADAITGFQFDFEHGAQPYDAFIDNVQVPPITAVPEPASLGLLALGGLLLKRRKH